MRPVWLAGSLGRCRSCRRGDRAGGAVLSPRWFGAGRDTGLQPAARRRRMASRPVRPSVTELIRTERHGFHWSRTLRRLDSSLTKDRQDLTEYVVLYDGRNPASYSARTIHLELPADHSRDRITSSEPALAVFKQRLRRNPRRPRSPVGAAALAMAQPARPWPASASSRSTPGWPPAAFTAVRVRLRFARSTPARAATSTTGIGRLLGHLENIRRVNVLGHARCRSTCATRSSPRRIAASTNTTGSIGTACCARSPRNFSAGGIRQGFSTITMQVAHNSFLADRYHGRSLRRKLVELRISRLLERELTKDQILEHYLNVIYLGNGVNGIEAASLDLFGKTRQQAHAARRRAARRAAQGAIGLHAAPLSAARGAAPQPRALR